MNYVKISHWSQTKLEQTWNKCNATVTVLAAYVACKSLIYKGNLCGDPYEIRTRIAAVKGRLNAVSTSHKRQNQAI